VIKEVRQREQLELLSKKLEDANLQLKAMDLARADFITLISHQLRTPPATIKWYLSAIKQGDYGAMDESVRQMIVKAEITNNSLISLIEDLLNASRIERGKMEFLFEPTDIEELARFTTEQLQPQAALKKLQLIYQKPVSEIPKVMADKEKLRQVINNFIDNAIKYTPVGNIKVWVESDAEKVVVKVKDTGKGVIKEIAASLFAKYARGKDSALHSTGIGLGLYVAKVVVDNHGGSIGVNSEGEGRGSTFYFSLPIHNDLPHTKTMDLVEQTGVGLQSKDLPANQPT
jgi:signal transduction histidine kinase